MAVHKLFLWLTILGIVLVGCSSPAAAIVPSAVPTMVPSARPIPPTSVASQTLAVQAAQAALAASLGVQPAPIQVINVTAVDWPDSCLGVQDPGKACAMIVTPGYKITLSANGSTYEVHTNMNGSSVKLVPNAASSQNPAVQSSIQNLSQKLHLNADQIKVNSVEAVQWPNGCLGVQPPGVMCNQLVSPGYRIILEAIGNPYEYHTNQAGSYVVLVATPTNNAGVPLLTWQSNETPCQTAQISVDGLAFGPCSGQLAAVSFVNPNRSNELKYFLQTYQSFTLAQTPAGSVTFSGQGQQAATAEVQRSMAEWALLLVNESESSHAGQNLGLVMTWHRSGGIAGLCNDLDIYASGMAYASSCRGGQTGNLGTAYLNPDQLKQLYSWEDNYHRFEIDRNNPGTADAINMTLIFMGSGTKAATTLADQALLLEFANSVFSQAANP
ncbi:MAG: hypothetical protein P4L50_29285 [Anaerolineaceae bacterium]|nr:hypothetical protein [Anaerolineaceae bacterium]